VSYVGILWTLWALLPGLEAGTCRYVLPPESAAQISDVLERAQGEGELTVHHIKVRPRSIVLNLSVDGERTLVTMERPKEAERAAGWRYFAPIAAPTDGELLEPLLRSFDQAFEEDPWLCMRDDDQDYEPIRSAPPSTSATWSPALALLLIAYASHWLLLLALVLLQVAETGAVRSGPPEAQHQPRSMD